MKLTFMQIMTIMLVCGCLFHPAASAVGLVVIFTFQIAEKYFTRNISDTDRKQLFTLKLDLEKIAQAQQKESLAKAFGGVRT